MACGPGEGLTPVPEKLVRHQGKAWICGEGSHSAGSHYWNTRITDQIDKTVLFCALQNNTWDSRRKNRLSYLKLKLLSINRSKHRTRCLVYDVY